jgi:branched-chain amino acid transport system substrate-binding protein
MRVTKRGRLARWISLPIVLVALGVWAAVGSWGGASPAGAASHGKTAGVIVLGGLFNLKGDQAALDVPSFHGAQLAVDAINRDGGLLGKRVALVVEDGKTRPDKLQKGTEKILRKYPSVSAFLGLSDTDMVLAAAPPAAAAGRVFLTSGATSPLLPGEVPTYLFLACFGDNVQAAAAAEYAHDELEANSAVVLYDSTDTYTVLLQGYFRTRFLELGGTIPSVEAYTPGDAAAAIDRLADADVVFLAAQSQDDIVATVHELRDAGFTVPILGGDAFDSEGLWAVHPEIDNLYYTTHAYLGADNPDPAVVDFRAAYRAAYPDEPPEAFAALGFDAANLLAEAIRRAGSPDPQDVLESLSRIDDFQGVTGRIGYEAASRIPRKSVSLIEVENGVLSLAKQFVPDSVPEH